MAAPQCMSQDGNAAVFIGTFLQTGQPVAVCDECMVPWAAAVLQGMTGVDPAPFLQAISEPDSAESPTEDEGGVAEWVENGDPPPTASRTRNGGRTRPKRSSDAAATGISNASEG
jgi:hypothetical protein